MTGIRTTLTEIKQCQPFDGLLTRKSSASPLNAYGMVAAKEAAPSSFMAEKHRRMSVATHKISLLNDASELGMATEEEKAALTEWKKYRVLLSRVDAEKPDFPVEPA